MKFIQVRELYLQSPVGYVLHVRNKYGGLNDQSVTTLVTYIVVKTINYTKSLIIFDGVA
jgi:hypothetical protein